MIKLENNLLVVDAKYAGKGMVYKEISASNWQGNTQTFVSNYDGTASAPRPPGLSEPGTYIFHVFRSGDQSEFVGKLVISGNSRFSDKQGNFFRGMTIPKLFSSNPSVTIRADNSYSSLSSSVTVMKGGYPLSGARVKLGFHGLGGMTTQSITDRHGQCEIQHASRGRADLFVNGTKIKVVTAPGSFSAHL